LLFLRWTSILKSSLPFDFAQGRQAQRIAFTVVNCGFKLVVSLASPEFTEGSN